MKRAIYYNYTPTRWESIGKSGKKRTPGDPHSDRSGEANRVGAGGRAWGTAAGEAVGRVVAGGLLSRSFAPVPPFPTDEFVSTSGAEAETNFFVLSAEWEITKESSFPHPLPHPLMGRKRLLGVVSVVNWWSSASPPRSAQVRHGWRTYFVTQDAVNSSFTPATSNVRQSATPRRGRGQWVPMGAHRPPRYAPVSGPGVPLWILVGPVGPPSARPATLVPTPPVRQTGAARVAVAWGTAARGRRRPSLSRIRERQ
jgi:hypothetical protein